MDLFYRGFDENARITSGARHVSAAAARLAVSIVRSIPQLPDAAWAEMKRLLTVNSLWSLCLVLAGWLIATVVGGVVGLAVNALLILYGLVELWETIKATLGTLKEWVLAAYYAEDDAGLDVAGGYFAAALSAGGITILEVLVTHRVFRAVEGKLRERFPTPDWLRKQYDEAAQKREARRKVEEPSRPEERPERAEEKPRRTEESPKAEEKKNPAERLKTAADTVASGSRYEGAKNAADDLPVAAAVVGGAVLVVGAVSLVAWAASLTSQKEQS